ncbi:hypothetical protein C2845_PM06G28070 [Panicum miliaceum]|uniref:Uncharacterized protein n=1 Tax=Panicum miliaceum TaxID=4540 RepID=A0A3L6R9B1_PANMI|nr:hypothetical protein C2845_PM06G28070 [Panicum miliaceum]
MAAYQEAVNDCSLTDICYYDLPYTWDNRQEAKRNVKARLDRAFGHNKFMDSLGDSVAYHLPLAESDNCGLLVEVREKLTTGR